MCVLGLAALFCTHEVGQALDVIDAHHVDVVIEAESLDEGEVNLQSDVTLVLLIGGEDAECHAVWIAKGEDIRAGQKLCFHSRALILKNAILVKIFTNCNTYTFMTLADS